MNKHNLLRILTDKKLKALMVLGVLFLMNMSVVFGGSGDISDVQIKLACLICKIMNLFFFIAGSIAALVIVIAGIKWVSSGDDPGARNSAKTSIVSAMVGLIIILLAVYIVTWMVSGFGVMASVSLTTMLQGCDTVGAGYSCT